MTTTNEAMRHYTFLGTTQCLCPSCLEVIPAKIIARGDRIYVRLMVCEKISFAAIENGTIDTIMPFRQSFPRRRLSNRSVDVHSIVDSVVNMNNTPVSRSLRLPTIAIFLARCATQIAVQV